MRTKFHILFSVEIVNRYFDTGEWNDVAFVPLPETEKMMRDNGYTFRKIGNKLLLMARVNRLDKILSPPAVFEKFSFMLLPQSNDYLYYTNFPFSAAETPCAYFNNLHGHTANGDFYLTHALPPYTDSVSYVPGNFIVRADGLVFECLRSNDGSVPLDDASCWAQLGSMPFVTSSDATVTYNGSAYTLRQAGPLYTHSASASLTEHRVRVYAFDGPRDTYTREVKSQTVKYDKPHNQVQVDLRGLPSGSYVLRVNDDIQPIYLNALPKGQPMYMDVFNLPATSPQALLGADGTLLNPHFRIAFAARRVLWRYKTLTDTIDRIEDSSGAYTFKPDGACLFISEQPIPFSHLPIKTLVAKSGDIKISTYLPNPRPQRLSTPQDDVYTAESFINF